MSKDSDRDRIVDAVEVNFWGTNPASADTDGDGIDDRREAKVHRTDPTNARSVRRG